ncbi:MAG: T9SS type A sorting domain-containing protein, partial [Candidatus Zixiibacteriota bacterium]
YDYDIYLHIDSAAGKDCTIEPFRCIDWHDFMPYRMVIVDDGMSELILSDFYEDATAGFERYLWSGGKLAYFGSLTGLEHHNADALPGYYEFRHQFGREYFDLDSMFFIGAGWYATHTEEPYIDSLAGFNGALSVHDGAPDVRYGYDTSASAMVGDLQALWPHHSPPSVAAFKAGTNAEITHIYSSLFPASSMVHSAPVGLHITRNRLEAFLYGFHLWYMDRSDARLLVDWIMSHTPTGTGNDVPESGLPDRVALHQNYPNPFNPFTIITFDLPRRMEVRLEVFNILGRRVKLLTDQSLGAGSHQITWNGDDRTGRKVASGVYFYRLTTDSAVETRKMVVLK